MSSHGCGCKSPQTNDAQKSCTCCPCRFILEQLRFPRSAFWLLALPILALAMAYSAQYIFGLAPCRLCYIERVPFYLTILFMLIALARRTNKNLVVGMFIASGIAMLANFGIAFYHVGVEQHWWLESVVGCDIAPLSTPLGELPSAADIRDALLNTQTVPCDEVTFSLLGLSAATWNVLLCFGLAVFAKLSALVHHKDIVIKEGDCCCKKPKCTCGPDCKCGCQQGKPCTCGDKK